MRCGACGASKLRKTERAIVLTGPGKLRSGRVCRACAAGGWLLVLGDADAGGPERVREQARKKREQVELAQEVFAQLQGAHAPPFQQCDALGPKGEPCELERSHEGKHLAELPRGLTLRWGAS